MNDLPAPEAMPESVAVEQIERLLEAATRGEPAVASELLPLVYDELRRLAACRMKKLPVGQTLQATALVHEAYLRLVKDGAKKPWDGRAHFFAAAAESMRRILVEHARRKAALKNGGKLNRLELNADRLAVAFAPREDLIALDDALRKLAARDLLKARLVELRYFAGLTSEEAAQVLGVSAATAERHWAFARAWLRREIGGQEDSQSERHSSGAAAIREMQLDPFSEDS